MRCARVDAGFFLSVAVFCLGMLGPGVGHGAGNDEGEVAHPTWFKTSFLDLRADLDEARRGGRSGIALFFHTPSCSYCKALLRTTFADPDVAARLPAEFDVLALDVLSTADVTGLDGNSHWAKDFAVREKATFTPTLVFFDSDGERILRLVGYYPPETFLRVLDYLQERRYQRQTLRSYLAQGETRPSTPVLDAGPGDPLFAPPPFVFDRRLWPSDRPLVVLFERSGCPPCERFQRLALAAPAVRDLLTGFEVARLDMEDADMRLITPAGERISARDWADALGLLHAPALVYFDESGREVLRVDSDLLVDAHGVALKEADPKYVDNVAARFRYVATKGYLVQPQFQQWRQRQTQAAGR